MKNIFKNNFIEALKTVPEIIVFLFKKDKLYMFIIFIQTIIFSIEKYPSLLIMKFTIDALTQQIGYMHYLRTIIPLLFILLSVKVIKIFTNTSHRIYIIQEKIFNEFFEKCMSLDYEIFENNSIQVEKDLSKDLTNRKIVRLAMFFIEMFSSLIAIIISSVALLLINPWILVILVISFILKTVIVKAYSMKQIPLYDEKLKKDRMLEYLYKIGSEYEFTKEYRIFNYKDGLMQKIGLSEKEEFGLTDKIFKNHFMESVTGGSVDFLSKLLAFISTGLAYFARQINLSDVTFVIGLYNDYMEYAGSFLESAAWFIKNSSIFNHYKNFMNQKNIYSKKITIREIPHVIEFNNVSFKYPNSDSFILKNVNFRFALPEKVSLVGHNGAGKTTIVKLILRLYKPTQGIITLDGFPIYDYDYADYYSLFSSVMQDFKLFAFKISENIASFSNNMDNDLVSHCIHESGIDSFLGKYPKGRETYISNAYEAEGIEFSGGEQQKIALARAIYKKRASFYILDEPSASYDADAESKLYKKYKELLEGKASIFISHRLTSCKLSDRILLLDNGKIIEEGSHSELMLKKGFYKNLYELQANQYRGTTTV
jgi:ABC-type multidrug transport system fused ATPase/permease subunit